MTEDIKLPPLPHDDIFGACEFMASVQVMAVETAQKYATEAIEADRKRRGEPAKDDTLWCLHILGPDDVYPAPSKAYAEVAADLHNSRFEKISKRLGVMCKAVVAPWPHSAESHAEGVDGFVEDCIAPQPAEPSRGKPVSDVRNAALEEAASLLEDRADVYAYSDGPARYGRNWAEAIRSLKYDAAPQPAEPVRNQRIENWTKGGVESLCISLDIQQEQSGGGSKACAVAASLLRGIAEQHFSEAGKP